MRRLFLLLVTALLAVSATAALADAPSPDNPAGRSNDILGIVAPLHAAGHGGGGGSNLTYHGGPVLRTNRTVAIYWGTGFASGYQSTINTYFTDVATASNTLTNVYSVETQYYDSTGPIAYSSTSGGWIVDTTNPVPDDCTDTVSATNSCVSDNAIRAEVARAVPNPDGHTIYFVFTGKGVGSCYSSSSCAFSSYCAYHSNFTASGKTYIYANQPYADTVPSACDSGNHPNGAATEADATINVTSHEHREAINDTFGNAWYDRRGYEGSDKCAWNFGTLTGPDYNQTIGSHHYILQQEWSNAASGCLLHG